MKVGRPLDYSTPEQLKEAIDKYFKETEQKDITYTGLLIHLDLTKPSFDAYRDREGYSNIVTMAKLFIENAYEIDLRDKGNAGTIFALKNFGWVDKQEIKQETTINEIKIKLPDDN